MFSGEQHIPKFAMMHSNGIYVITGYGGIYMSFKDVWGGRSKVVLGLVDKS